MAACQAGCGASLNDEAANALSPAAGSAAGPAVGTETGNDGSRVGPAPGASPNAVGLAAVGTTASTAKATNFSTPGPAKPIGSPTPTGAPGTAYKIGAQDVLEVSVFKVPELNKSVQVANTGTVNLPLVGEITAAGRTAQEVERELTQKLGAKYLQSPQVSVYVKEFNSQNVTIDGAIRKPGVFPYRSSVSLLQVITMAGGLDPNSDSTVVVFRTTNGERKAARFDVSEIQSGQANDPVIEPGDVIVAGTSAVKEAFNNVLKALPLAGMFVGL